MNPCTGVLPCSLHVSASKLTRSRSSPSQQMTSRIRKHAARRLSFDLGASKAKRLAACKKFMRLEAEAIDFASKEAAVVALGGGAIVQPRAIQGLLDRGTIVYLSAPPEILVERIGDGAKRPLLAGLDPDGRVERLTSLLAERRVHYEKASITVDASRNADEVVDEIVVALQHD